MRTECKATDRGIKGHRAELLAAMIVTVLLGVLVGLSLGAGPSIFDDNSVPPAAESVSAPKSPSALAAIKKRDAAVEKARKAFEQAKIEANRALVDDLDACLKAQMSAGNLEEAKRIDGAKKEAREGALGNEISGRLVGTKWHWDTGEWIRFDADGVLFTSWMKAPAYWYTNPDGTVTWVSMGHPWATIMTFNSDLTKHKSHVPTRADIDRAGDRF